MAEEYTPGAARSQPVPRRLALLAIAAACGAPVHPAAPPRAPLALTYLGVAGWELEADGAVILTDPYLSRPADFDAPLVSDAAAIAAHTPARADLVLIGHSHVDHLLDAPAVALRTGAQLVGSASTTRVGRASGVPDDHLITIAGGEDFEFGRFSVRVIPSLHSALENKHFRFGSEIAPAPHLPMPAAGYEEGGTFAYLVRVAGREVLVLDTANFIEREVAGLRPDIAIIAPGFRREIHDYTCRLLHALGDPPVVIATHFDDWQGAPADAPPDADLAAFGAEVARCSPRSRFIIPQHFARMIL